MVGMLALPPISASVATAGGAPSITPLILEIFGTTMLFVTFGFAKMVLVNGFRLSEKKDANYAKSSIVRSSVCLVLSIIGVILCFFGTQEYNIAIGGIMTFVFVALALGCDIVNKVLAGKFAASKEEAPKAE